MNFTVYFFGGGYAFFVGIALLLAAVAIACCSRAGWLMVTASLVAIFGLLLVLASGTPLSIWLYLTATAVTLWWLTAERFDRFAEQRWPVRAAVVLIWLAAAALEIPYLFVPDLAALQAKRITIYADSVTAGMGSRGEVTWPKVLAAASPIELIDRTNAGETARSAQRVAEEHPPQEGVVLLEIGGNDLLGGRSSQQFEEDLERLLQQVAGPGRTIVMLELPLPPLCNNFGAAQRRLAAKYDVRLVPRRHFVDILATEQLTLDGIHLSNRGHERMATMVAELFGI